RQKLEDEVRGDTSLDPRGYPDFKIRPPGVRAEQHVLIYLEPMEENRFAFGLDINVTPAQIRAQTNARDTGALISSGRLLNVGKDRSVGVGMRLAIYRSGAPVDTVEERRAAYLGTVGAGYNIRKLMTGVLEETTMAYMRYRLSDLGPVSAAETAGGTGL